MPGDYLAFPAIILIVDDQEFVRRNVRSLLAKQAHWKIYEAADGKQAVDETRRLRPDVAVLDIVMPVMSGIEAAYEMRRLAPELGRYLDDGRLSATTATMGSPA